MIVIGGVLIALAADQWAEGRADRALERQLSEYYQTIERLEQWTGNWRIVQQDVERIIPELMPLRVREAVMGPAARIRIEGMARVQGNQYGVLTEIRELATETLQAVEAAVSGDGKGPP